MDEKRLQEIESAVNGAQDIPVEWLERRGGKQAILELVAEVRRLRGLLDAVRLTVPSDAVNENLRRNIQAAISAEWCDSCGGLGAHASGCPESVSGKSKNAAES